MARPVVLLAVPMGEERRELALETLGSFAEVLVRADLSDEALARRAPEIDVLVTGGFPREIPDAVWPRMTRLRLLQTLAAGVDHLPYDRIPARVTIASNAGAHRIAIAEHSMALLLAAAKNVVRHTEAIRAGRFPQDLMGKSVRGKTLGVVGLGGIGGEAARLAVGLGMRAVGINRHGASDAPVAWAGTMSDLDRLLRESDFVLLSIPLTRHTLGIIGARELGLMRRDAVLINIARGKLIRERDLYEHLRANPEFVAALDVWWAYPKGEGRPFTEPFHELPNVVMTPHVAWAVPEQSARSLEAALENVVRFLRGEPPRNVVDREEYAFEAT
ncbi:MAG: hydroxyacid dehydrogenase [Methanobacteriota archaeon]|nr:MAG: hydroxyacid dehydrogenase [Euryarchaeota archaeon]